MTSAANQVKLNKNIIFWCEFSNASADRSAHCSLVSFINNNLEVYEPLKSRQDQYLNQSKKKLPDGMQPNGLANFVKLIISKRVRVSFTYNNIKYGKQRGSETNCRQHCAKELRSLMLHNAVYNQ